jgi:hypothetical protein
MELPSERSYLLLEVLTGLGIVTYVTFDSSDLNIIYMHLYYANKCYLNCNSFFSSFLW